MVAIKGHFDGKVFVPDEPVNLPSGQAAFKSVGSPKKTPAIECGDGKVLLNPSMRELAKCAGIWRGCTEQSVDLAIVGAGPAGIHVCALASEVIVKPLTLTVATFL